MSAKGIHLQVGTIILLYVLLGSSSSGRAQPGSLQQPVQTCPTGSLLAFSKTDKSSQAPDRVYIRRSGSFDRRIWETPALAVTFNENGDKTNAEQGVGFIVPQLDRGRYDAWYGGPNLTQAAASLTFDAIPQLLVENAITRGQPLSEVEVDVRIFSPKLIRKGSAIPEQVSAVVTLKASDPSLAEIVSSQRVRTDKDGYARWRLRIKKAGITRLVAFAHQFESAVLTVVGMPAPGPSFSQAELAYLNDRASELELSAASAVAVADQRAAKLKEDERIALVANRVGGVSARPDPDSSVREQAILKQRSEVIRLRDRATQAELQAKAARAAVQAWIAATAHEPRLVSEQELQPGDVLLVMGSSTISEKIRNFEQRNLGGEVSYSHASLYLGEFNHVKMVGEMWSSGFWITPLSVSVQGTYLVDVYRFRQLEDAKRQELADLTAHMFSNCSRVVRTDSPSFLTVGSFLPYAFEEIALLGLAGTGWPGRVLTFTIQNLVDPNAGGRRKMICSELVAWTYHDAGLELDVPYWKVLSDLNIFINHERQHDYTTPNMLAHSRNLGIVGRYRVP